MNKRLDSKVESNDSPEIPHRGETDIPGLPSGEAGSDTQLNNTVSKRRKATTDPVTIFWGRLLATTNT